MTPLERIVRERIAATGGLSVAEFMTLCLAHPEHGYYMAHQPFGRDGDFITAPEVSQMFGELVGAWLAAGWRAMGAPDPAHIVELGPGRGVLMHDALRAARVMPGFLDAARVHLVETSPRLRAEQAARLGGHEVRWHEDIATLPDDGPLMVVANEFFDALPVHHYERTPEGWRERLVVVSDGALAFAAVGDVLDDVPDWAAGAPVGAVIELAPARAAYAAELAGRIATQGGALLIIDYGHAQPGMGETLQAVKGHQRVDVFHQPGMSDLTAHVDFTALAQAIAAVGLEVYGPVRQGDFLNALGLQARLDALLRRADARQKIMLKRGAKRLADPAQMGHLFKVLAAVPKGAVPPAPFTGD